MFLAVQLESRLIYCLNKACLTASASVISHRTVLTGSRPLGCAVSLSLSLFQASLSLEQRWWQEAQLGPRYRSHLMERGLGNSRVAGQIYLERLSFEMHTCGRVKDTWCKADALETVPLCLSRDVAWNTDIMHFRTRGFPVCFRMKGTYWTGTEMILTSLVSFMWRTSRSFCHRLSQDFN